MCKHCLHTRDDHDIKDEENLRSVTVGKILFAPDVTVTGSPSTSPGLPRAKCVLCVCGCVCVCVCVCVYVVCMCVCLCEQVCRWED